jgi:hypothetical protein
MRTRETQAGHVGVPRRVDDLRCTGRSQAGPAARHTDAIAAAIRVGQVSEAAHQSFLLLIIFDCPIRLQRFLEVVYRFPYLITFLLNVSKQGMSQFRVVAHGQL